MELTSLRRLAIRGSVYQNIQGFQHLTTTLTRTGIVWTHIRWCPVQIYREQVTHCTLYGTHGAVRRSVHTEMLTILVEVPETDAAFEVLANRLVDELNEIVQRSGIIGRRILLATSSGSSLESFHVIRRDFRGHGTTVCGIDLNATQRARTCFSPHQLMFQTRSHKTKDQCRV